MEHFYAAMNSFPQEFLEFVRPLDSQGMLDEKKIISNSSKFPRRRSSLPSTKYICLRRKKVVYVKS